MWSLPPDIAGISVTVAGPSQSPARLFKVVNDFCASDGTEAEVDFSASVFSMSDCAKAPVEINIRETDSQKRRDFIFILLKTSLISGQISSSRTQAAGNQPCQLVC